MIPKPLTEVTKADLEALATNRVHEGRTIEYKRDVKLASDEDKRETARDVSSFANAAGGDLIFGVVEATDDAGKNLGYPEKIVGVPDNFDDFKLRFDSITRDTIDPRVQGIVIHPVDGFERGPAIIVRVPKSWSPPHMVTYRNQTHFYSRNNSGKQGLDVREIRASVLAGAEIGDRVRRFRDARLGAIIAGETPVAMDPGAKVVVHAIPLTGFEQGTLDVRDLNPNNDALPPLEYSGGWNWRFNLDGIVAYTGNAEPHHSYTQAFRHGALEGVAGLWIARPETGPPHMYLTPIETTAAKAAELYVRKLRAVGVEVPISVLVTVLGVRGIRGRHDNYERSWEKNVLIDRDVLPLPDVLIDPERRDLASLLRPVFDALWQASGYERSFGYDKDGNWDPKVHR